MKYVSNISGNGIRNKICIPATHPKQVVRKHINYMKFQHPEFKKFNIIVANESGEVWMFNVFKKDNEYLVKDSNTKIRNLNKPEIKLIFNGVEILDIITEL